MLHFSIIIMFPTPADFIVQKKNLQIDNDA